MYVLDLSILSLVVYFFPGDFLEILKILSGNFWCKPGHFDCPEIYRNRSHNARLSLTRSGAESKNDMKSLFLFFPSWL